MKFMSSSGDEFLVGHIAEDGIACRACSRIIRVRERAAFFGVHLEPQAQWMCRECLYAEPLTEHNKWRKDHPSHE